MSNTHYSTFGIITKKETLASVENQTNSQALVLENLSPFPGYHGLTVPDSLEPDSMFAVTKLMHKEEVVIRAIQEVKLELNFDFDAAPASFSINNNPRNSIRFKNLKYALIGDVLREFEKKGISFRKARKVQSYSTIIKVHKFFLLEQIDKNIYKDVEDNKMNYFSVPALLRWNTFEKITMNCKYNLDDNNFDAALASVFLNKGIIDLVRIYDSNSSIEKLSTIRKKYIEALGKQ